MRCSRETYICASTDPEDGLLIFTAECNGGPPGDCGFYVDLTKEPWAFGITQEDVEVLHLQHVDKATG